MGLGQIEHFQRYHRVLNRAVWSGREASRVLLGLLVRTFVPDGPLVIGVDETLERRTPAKPFGRRRGSEDLLDARHRGQLVRR